MTHAQEASVMPSHGTAESMSMESCSSDSEKTDGRMLVISGIPPCSVDTSTRDPTETLVCSDGGDGPESSPPKTAHNTTLTETYQVNCDTCSSVVVTKRDVEFRPLMQFQPTVTMTEPDIKREPINASETTSSTTT